MLGACSWVLAFLVLCGVRILGGDEFNGNSRILATSNSREFCLTSASQDRNCQGTLFFVMITVLRDCVERRYEYSSRLLVTGNSPFVTHYKSGRIR